MNANGVQGAVASVTYQTPREVTVDRSAIASTPVRRSGGEAKSVSLDFTGAVAAAPMPIDARKVQMIRDLIGSGAYPIDARAIAAKMVSADLRT
jgi:negative regulator of flagellin synthesis FlgM